ncbi:MAG: type II secretion system F family protein, partial [Desulfurobacteriaceae bacterium]
MATYKVTLLTPDGEVIEELVEAENEEELLRRYLNTNLLLLDYKKDWLKPFLKDFTLSSVSVEELADFCFYVGRALEMGIPILEVLEDIEKSSRHPKLRNAVARVKEKLMAGSPLSEAMAVEKVFPPQLVGLVKIGENSDALPQVFLNYARYLDWLSKLRKEVKQALSYPAFVSLVMVGVIAIMFGYIIPQIIPALESLGLKEYPLPTKILLWSGKYVPLYWKQAIFTTIAIPISFSLLIKRS